MDTPQTIPTERYSEADEAEFKQLYREYVAFRSDFHALADEDAVAAHFALQKLKDRRA